MLPSVHTHTTTHSIEEHSGSRPRSSSSSGPPPPQNQEPGAMRQDTGDLQKLTSCQLMAGTGSHLLAIFL